MTKPASRDDWVAALSEAAKTLGQQRTGKALQRREQQEIAWQRNAAEQAEQAEQRRLEMIASRHRWQAQAAENRAVKEQARVAKEQLIRDDDERRFQTYAGLRESYVGSTE